MNSQHKFTSILHNLKCLILVVDTWVVNTLYTTFYIPLVIKNNLSFCVKFVKYSINTIILNNVNFITTVKNKKVRIYSIFQILTENKFINKFTNHHILLEWIWTIIPLLIMVVILFVSLLLLYSAYGSGGIWITTYIIKIIGSQWFWTYEVLNNLTNLHYVDFYTQSLQYNTSVLFSLISHSLPHLSYAIDTNKNGFNILPNTLSDTDFILDMYIEKQISIENKRSIVESCSTNNFDSLKESYSIFLANLREFSKSEEKLNFYEIIRLWSNTHTEEYINAIPIPNYKNIIFDSNILKNTYLNKDKPMRLLDVDNRLYLSMKHPIDIYVTTNDVIHSYAVPSFGIKLDSLPGRINYGCTFVLRPGIYYGQCSELCGLNHAYMPTSIVILNKNKVLTLHELLEHTHIFQLKCLN